VNDVAGRLLMEEEYKLHANSSGPQDCSDIYSHQTSQIMLFKHLSIRRPTTPSRFEYNDEKTSRSTNMGFDESTMPDDDQTRLPAAPSTTDGSLEVEKLAEKRSLDQMDFISAQSNSGSTSKAAVNTDLEMGEQVIAKKRWWSSRSKRAAPSRKNTFGCFCKEALLSSWVNVLLVFIPVGIAVHFAPINPVVVFIMNFLAIVPLAGVKPFSDRGI